LISLEDVSVKKDWNTYGMQDRFIKGH